MNSKKKIHPLMSLQERGDIIKDNFIDEIVAQKEAKRSINNNPSGRNFCCEPNCDNDATFEIRFSNSLEDYTHSCNSHLSDLIAGSNEVTLTTLNQ